MGRSGRRASRWLTGVALLPLALAGCKEQVTTLDDVAAVRAVHASPDLPAVDVYIEGITIPLAMNLEYGDASDFGLLPAVKGAIFEVRPTGADPRSDPLFMSLGFTLAPSEISTAALGGLAESDDPVDSLRVVLDPEDFDLVTGGTWRARFSNMVSDVAQISIDIGSDGIVDETVDRFRPTDVAGLPLSSDSTTFLTIVVPGGGSFSGGMPPFEEGSEVFVYITGMASVPDTDPRRLQLLFMNEDSETALVPLE
ncbi:MAG: DUF4397 domain-containing protein [marine benthic group bacterium]|jgi:hypothetical protein|nr:DUF4397 domain-containing protein [Gemmatimonadota bacterium]